MADGAVYRSAMVQDPQRIDLSLEPLDDYVVIQPTDEEAETRTARLASTKRPTRTAGYSRCSSCSTRHAPSI